MGILMSVVEAEFACRVELFLKFMEKLMHNVSVLISLHMHVMPLTVFFWISLILINGFVIWICYMNILQYSVVDVPVKLYNLNI